MCKSRADGGQRCYSHARQALDAALSAARERRDPLKTLQALGAHDARLTYNADLAIDGRILRTQRDLASTPKGPDEFQAQADQARADGDYQTFARLVELIDHGKMTEERNTALAHVARTEQASTQRSMEPAQSLRLTPAQIREALDAPLTPDQVTRACDDLGPTLKALHASVSARSSAELHPAERLQHAAPFDFAERLWRTRLPWPLRRPPRCMAAVHHRHASRTRQSLRERRIPRPLAA